MMDRLQRASIIIVSAAVALIGLSPGHGSATGDAFTLGITSAGTAPGGLVAIDVSVRASEPGLGSYTIDVNYDTAVLTPHSCQTVAAGCNRDYRSGTVRIAGVSFAPIVGDRTIATIVFAATGLPGSASPLDLSATGFYDYTGRDISAETQVTDGAIIITAAAPTHPIGDADCDGHLTASDSLAVLDHAAHNPTPACIPLADTNCDGRVNTNDAIAILAVLSATSPPFQPAC